ncbi:DUF4417 domain-containing protein [Paludicola sp. MB14-C6]|uniref:DUF4417 domain-containing protein n=1 Tax=Paludihabitans sp. MB14-C6 TaxID=3070656 RepID=UPI0027DBCBD9|nr:DUF4417 domain-containing protein [Paludicola sp. MB14-C6]WMJ22566.1 DUF4417 domain-containing protein [Paludicola sp. MB14-C6]
MTEENYNYRTSPFLLRNQFDGEGQFKIPIISKAEFAEEDFLDLLLIGFDRTNLQNNNHLQRMVHFFLYDYKFERVWKNPDNAIEKLKRYKAVLSPDFSMYREMNPTMQMYNTFRNRWCGSYFASKGIPVIPTISWGDMNTYDFCFKGVPKGSTVAVTTYMVSEHNNHSDQKEFFLKGYNEMLRQIEPERIICYNNPFPEMRGNIVFVDYELSSWKYQNDDYIPSKYVDYILGKKPLPNDSPIVIKSGYITGDDISFKGMGSAFGGEWRPSPNKPDDQRLIGKPGNINRTKAKNKHGDEYDRETKIGDNGKAQIERHHSDHGNPNSHSNPHDHNIDWNKGFPYFGKQINYSNGAPEFKNFQTEMMKMEKEYMKIDYSNQDLRFHTISEFEWCMKQGGEVEFCVGERAFGVFPLQQKTINAPSQILICEKYVENQEATEKWYNTADEALEYLIDGVRLRDIITKVEVTDRTI